MGNCDAMGSGVTQPFQFSRHYASEPHQQAAIRGCTRLPKGLFVKVFQFFFLLKVCFQRKDLSYRPDPAGLGGSTSLRVGGFQFSIGTFLLSWSRPHAHSILLFVDFWAHVF